MQFLSPISAKRVEAIEETYDIAQQAIETGELQLSEYETVRRRSIYLPRSISLSAMQNLAELLRAVREQDNQAKRIAVDGLKMCQTELRRELGITEIEAKLNTWRETTQEQSNDQ
ncbi:MAG: hypothetical protein IID42_03570 [Planctomycetes bacterium]|nr:hypothetical protein [Planctomycetota bacterium]